jgi:hypothetical protein
LQANPVPQADRMRSETPASPQTCVPLIPCLTPTFGSCFNAEQVKVNINININININFNFNFNFNGRS